MRWRGTRKVGDHGRRADHQQQELCILVDARLAARADERPEIEEVLVSPERVTSGDLLEVEVDAADGTVLDVETAEDFAQEFEDDGTEEAGDAA